jgi:hypothetical protein
MVEPAPSWLGLTPPMCPTSIRAHRNFAAPLAPDDERLAADRELIPNARVGHLARPHLERGGLGMDAGVAEAEDRVRRLTITRMPTGSLPAGV